MKTVMRLSFILITATLFAACGKIEKLPDTPGIEFTSFTVFDTTDILDNKCKGGRLNFYFEDGDGDLGVDPSDNPFDNDTINVFFTAFRKNNGTMVEITDDSDVLMPSDYRIPYLEVIGQNPILKGTVSISFLYTFYNSNDKDTIRYDFYIKDRANNLSNIESTSEIPLSYNGKY